MLTVFRVTGGASPHPQENEYRITPYSMERETDRYYYEQRDGRKHIHNKRTTANSKWFDNVDDALDFALGKINQAIENIHISLGMVLNTVQPSHHFTRILYVCSFKYEVFQLQEYSYLSYKNRGKRLGWRIDNDKTRTKQVKREAGFVPVETSSGRCYIYQHVSQPHNPLRPYERWVGTELDIMKILIEQYGNDRIRHLEYCKQHLREWVRLFAYENRLSHSTERVGTDS